MLFRFPSAPRLFSSLVCQGHLHTFAQRLWHIQVHQLITVLREGGAPMFDNLLLGLNFIVDPINFLVVLLGVMLGIIVGILPGLGSTASVAILIPVTLWMTPTQAIAMMGALYASSTTGGSITAILFKIPGESNAAVVVFDGYTMAKKGNVARALGLAMTASAIVGSQRHYVDDRLSLGRKGRS